MPRPPIQSLPRPSLDDAAKLARAAMKWASFADGRSGRLDAHDKALTSLEFSLRLGRGAFCIPSKLVATEASQRALRALHESGIGFGIRLDIEKRPAGLAVTLRGELLGYVQRKHAPWVQLLLPVGLEVRLLRLTEGERRGKGLGVNILFAGAEGALSRLQRRDR